MEYRQATEVKRIAEELIEQHHPHLHGVRVTAVFMNKTPTSKGRAVWGRAKKISGLPAFLADENGMPGEYEDQPPDFFVIEISEEKWSLLSEAGKRALVDEQLVKLDIVEDEEGRVNLAVVDRGVVVIPELIARHGLYNDSLKGAAAIGAEQLELLPEEERDTARAGRIARELRDDMQQRGIEVTMLAGKPEEVDPETGEVLSEAGSRA